jgi:proline dehydrogenase
VEPLVPAVEAQQNDLGQDQAQAQAQEQAMHGMENENEATARIKTFCPNIIKTLARPLLGEAETATG